MRTNVVIDDTLMAKALAASDVKTKREVIDIALRHFVQMRAQHDLLALRGKVHWEGDLEAMRLD